jgi:hypothetical protein
MMFANDQNQLKIIKVLAFVCSGVLLIVLGWIPGIKNTEHSGENDPLISDAAFSRFEAALGAGKTTMILLAVFAVICSVYFLTMWRSHERREP